MVFLYKLVFVFILSGVLNETGMFSFSTREPNASLKHDLSLTSLQHLMGVVSVLGALQPTAVLSRKWHHAAAFSKLW